MIFCFVKIVLIYGVSLILKFKDQLAIIHSTVYFFPDFKLLSDPLWRWREGEFLNNTCNVWWKLCIK